ncbi:MAG: flagellar biosynthesis anti-sigma factor FlgM [Polyangiaceae bacterium]
MKGITSNPALDAYQRTAVTPVGPGPRSSAGGDAAPLLDSSQAAKVSISSEARALASGASEVEQGNFDQDKVEQLRAALAAGSLKFDSSAIAEKMIDQAG